MVFYEVPLSSSQVFRFTDFTFDTCLVEESTVVVSQTFMYIKILRKFYFSKFLEDLTRVRL